MRLVLSVLHILFLEKKAENVMKKRTITRMGEPDRMCDKQTCKYFLFLEYKEANM